VEFRSYSDLAADIAAWAEALPRTIDVIVGVPRSGMLPATMLALHLGLPLTDIDAFAAGVTYTGGARLREAGAADTFQHALVVDDSIATGRAMREAQERLAGSTSAAKISFGVVYATPDSFRSVDHHHVALKLPRVFEWNVLQHRILSDCCMDIDGVLCRDPGSMENDDGPAYVDFLTTVGPRHVPRTEVGWLVTNRLERYRPETEAWLAQHGVRYRELVMHPAATGAERVAAGDHSSRKADVYKRSGAFLFIESDIKQATAIARLTARPVYCTDTRELVQPPRGKAALASAKTLHKRAPGAAVRRAKRLLAKARSSR
jgi:orotate phosphoribosyltransferase